MVVDRLLLCIYTVGCIIGAFVLLLNAPVLYDSKQPLQENSRTGETFEDVIKKTAGLS